MNETTHQQPNIIWRWLRILANIIVCLSILGAAGATIVVINHTEPVAKKANTTRKSSALVETTTVKRGTYAPQLAVLGNVQPAQQITLSPRVRGQVIELASEFLPGGMLKKGDVLLRIDPADFKNAVSISESELEQAEALMEIELARQQLAKKELKLLEGSIDNTNRGLVMREPQIASIKAEVNAAKAAVERAKLDLERATVVAPFDAQVLTRSVNVGSQVGPGDDLGTLVGLDEFWIIATVPVRSLRWVPFPKVERLSPPFENADAELRSQPQQGSHSIVKNPESTNGSRAIGDDCSTNLEAVQANRSAIDSPSGSTATDSIAKGLNVTRVTANGSNVKLRNPDSWGADVEREARVARLIGTLDQQTRLARVLITVDDPLGQNSDAPPLILNSLLETEITGRPIEDVVRLDREFIRDQDTVWVMKNDKLEIRETEIIFRDAHYAYIRTGLDDGDDVVTTTLATVAEGVGLRKSGETSVNESSDSGKFPRQESVP